MECLSAYGTSCEDLFSRGRSLRYLRRAAVWGYQFRANMFAVTFVLYNTVVIAPSASQSRPKASPYNAYPSCKVSEDVRRR